MVTEEGEQRRGQDRTARRRQIEKRRDGGRREREREREAREERVRRRERGEGERGGERGEGERGERQERERVRQTRGNVPIAVVTVGVGRLIRTFVGAPRLFHHRGGLGVRLSALTDTDTYKCTQEQTSLCYGSAQHTTRTDNWTQDQTWHCDR